jgi:hypothetical protein
LFVKVNEKNFIRCLLFKSSITFAEWTFVGESPDKSVKLFITKSTTQQISQYKRVWTREEFSSNSEMSKDLKVRSARHLEEYDCREKNVFNFVFNIQKPKFN